LAEAFDSNRDGVFDAQDAKFAEFKVWQDADQDGVSDAGEVRSLADWGINSINLVSDGVVRTPAAGVIEAGRTTATATDGTSVLVSDAAFEYRAATDVEVLMRRSAEPVDGHLSAVEATDPQPGQGHAWGDAQGDVVAVAGVSITQAGMDDKLVHYMGYQVL
jgi:hypothetical protein